MPAASEGSVPASAPTEAQRARRIARNVGALTAARGATVLLQLAVTAYLTRTLAPEHFGILGFGTALLSYFSLLVTFGFNTLGTRELARAPERASELAGHLTAFQLLLSVVGYALFLGTVLLLPKPALVKTVLAVQGLALFTTALSLEWVYLGVERMGVLAVRNVVAALLHVGGVLLFVHRPDDVVWAAAAQVGAVLVGNGWILLTFVRDFGRLRLRVAPAVWWRLLKPAVPIAASSFMIAIYYQLDQVMLGLMRGEAEVGLYTAGYRVLTAALIPAQILHMAFFPALSATLGDTGAMRLRVRAYVRAMALLGAPIAVGGVLLAGPLLTLVAGEAFAAGTTAFAFLMANAGLVYVNMAFGQPLVAWDRQRAYFAAVGAGALANVVLNALLIPRYGLDGAAIATVTSEVVVLLGVLPLHVRLVHQAYLGLWARAAAAAALGVGGPVLSALALGASPLVAGLLAVPGYALAAWTFRLATPATIRTLFRPPA